MDGDDMTWEATPKTDMLQLALDSLREYERAIPGSRPAVIDLIHLAQLRTQFAATIELRRIATALEGLVAP
jgi:hypothetical protein